MLKQIIVIGWILVICLHTGKETLIYSWYSFANPSFERLFCSNLDRPELQCHGKCHLQKMVQPNTDPSPAPMPAFPELKDLQFPYAFFYGSPWRTFNHNYKNFQPYTGPTLLVENLNSALVFRPPESQVA